MFRNAVDVLSRARLVHRVVHTAAQGLPLGAQQKPTHFKLLPFDVPSYLVEPVARAVHSGALAEVFVGLELVAHGPATSEPRLFCWHRQAASANAEVDYVVAHRNAVVPIEVKAGVRVSHENFGSVDDIDIVPLYAVGRRFSRRLDDPVSSRLG